MKRACPRRSEAMPHAGYACAWTGMRHCARDVHGGVPVSIRRWIEGVVLAVWASWAQADACHDALARFDYARAAELAQTALATAPSDAMAGLCAARAAYETGDFAGALRRLRAVEASAAQAELRTYAWNWLTVTLRRLGREDEAFGYGRAALAAARTESSRQNLATALHNLAGLLHLRGDVAGALALYRESIPLNPDLAERSASLNNVGLILQAQGDRAGAARWIEAAVALNRAHDHLHHLGKHLMNLGNLRREAGDPAGAQALLDEGVDLVERAGDRYWMAVAARYRGWLARDRAERDDAARWLALAAQRYQATGARADADAAFAEAAGL